MLNFSPIFATLSTKTSDTFFPVSSIDSCSNKLSTSAGFFKATCFAIASTKALNSAFCATKSVSEFTSTTAPTFPSSDTYPLSRNNSIAFSMSPSVSVKTFLQSIIPAPVFSLNSFTIAADTILISSYFYFYLKLE